MRNKIIMDKMIKLRTLIVICIVAIALGFIGGAVYDIEDYIPTVGLSEDQSKYHFEYTMPIEKGTSAYWLSWAVDYHTMCLETDPNRDDSAPYRYHEDALEMYKDMKIRALQFYDKWPKVPW